LTTTTTSTAIVPFDPVFADRKRLALGGFFAGYGGLTRDAYELDLHQCVAWCDDHNLELFQARRVDIEEFAPEPERRGRAPG
jgi:integrase/recombinase XerD